MTGRQPTVVTSRRRQHELLRTWTTWTLTHILIDPAPEVASARGAGWSGTHHHDPSTGVRIVGRPEGLGFGVDESWHNPTELIPWPEVEAIATGLPDDARQALVEFRSRWRDHQRAYPRFIPTADAVGCGPVVPDTPLTPSQEAYQRELEAFENSGVLPAWKQKRSDLEAEQRNLHSQALPLGSTSEPEDLLDLLDDQTVRAGVTRKAAAPTAALEQLPEGSEFAQAQRPALRPPGPPHLGEEQRPRSTSYAATQAGLRGGGTR